MVTITNTENELTFNMKVEGASLTETKAFLTFTQEEHNIQVPVDISESGECRVQVKPGMLKPGAQGTMVLEVVAKDRVFSLWESEFVCAQILSNNAKENLLETLKKHKENKEETQTQQQVLTESAAPVQPNLGLDPKIIKALEKFADLVDNTERRQVKETLGLSALPKATQLLERRERKPIKLEKNDEGRFTDKMTIYEVFGVNEAEPTVEAPKTENNPRSLVMSLIKEIRDIKQNFNGDEDKLKEIVAVAAKKNRLSEQQERLLLVQSLNILKTIK